MLSRIHLAPGWPGLLLLLAPPALAATALAAVAVYVPAVQPDLAASLSPVANPVAAGGRAGAGVEALPPPGGLLVQVSGAVVHPGLYRTTKGERVYAAIAAAGGLATDVDPERLPDLAARLRDGQHIRVPARSAGRGSGSSRAGWGGRGDGATDLNMASADQLAAIPGFSRSLAAEAVRYRTEFGGFSTPRELVSVLGMGEADFRVARAYLKAGP